MVSPHFTISSAAILLSEFRAATSNPRPELEDTPHSPNNQQVPQPRPHWVAPPPGYSKINCDAAWNPPTSARLGAIIRNSAGDFQCGSASSATCGSAAEAEASAVLLGVSLAVSYNLKMVQVESDAKEIITDLRGMGREKNWRTYPILEQIRRKAESFDDFKWDWIPREANMAAHIAATLANGSVGPLRWANQPPPSLTLVLRNDGLPCPPMAEG
ncbi:uncharacterized protein LOC133723160 [Rosa rugosa]|uniref:uncharacterized protein LOC133723160 n=1 Tax=Rosa rugosa TaxID=74645 RepID=UPI002B41696F|nr:uncharacterized protein LOC133723160 [Rosa rugosa]